MNKNLIGFLLPFIIANTHLHSQSNDSIYGIDLNEVIIYSFYGKQIEQCIENRKTINC